MMKSSDFPGGRPLFIGSLPMKDHVQALKEVLERTPETPHWVQLPANPPEGFLVQFCEGAPGLRTEPKLCICNGTEAFEAELVDFYEEFLAVSEGKIPLGDSRFAVSRRMAPGLYMLAEALRGRRTRLVKGQISGPLSVLVGIHDQAGRCAYYDERVREAVLKLLTLKARWQVEFIARGGHPAMVFVDEPALGGLGSSTYISISPEEALSDLGEVLEAIREAGGRAGVHVCANADWGALLSVKPDVLSFDAYAYFERLALFREDVLEFVRQGGMLAWGLVPTEPETLGEVQPHELTELWRRQAEALTGGALPVEQILARTFITPSCGLGSLELGPAIRAMDLTVEVSNRLREGVSRG